MSLRAVLTDFGLVSFLPQLERAGKLHSTKHRVPEKFLENLADAKEFMTLMTLASRLLTWSLPDYRMVNLTTSSFHSSFCSISGPQKVAFNNLQIWSPNLRVAISFSALTLDAAVRIYTATHQYAPVSPVPAI